MGRKGAVSSTRRDERRRTWAAPRPSGKTVRRGRLEAVLDRAGERTLTSVVAAAGTGKTTLAAAWAAQQAERRRPVLWLSQRHHRDLESALLVARGCAGSVPRDAVVDELAAAQHPAEVVVVDDAHLLPAPQLALLRRVLHECPEAVHLVLLGRRDPVLPLVGLGPGEVATVRARELRFAPDEAERLVRAHAPTCPRRDLEVLVEQTGGWAAALVLGARSLLAHGGDVPARLRLELTEQPVLDHLLGGYFDTMDPWARGMLLACCQEPDLDAQSASVLSGLSDADRHLTSLAEEGLLVMAVHDPQRPGGVVWQLHPLLRELLRRRTAPTGPDWQVVVDAHVRASRHYAEQGDEVLALRHAHRSGDAAAVLAALLQYGASFAAAEAFEDACAALLCLPEQVKSSTPHLLALEALQHRAHGRPEVALSVAHRASALFATAADPGASVPPPPAGALASLTEVELWRSALGLGDSDAAAAQARQLLGCHVSDDHHTHVHSDLELGPAASLMIELAALETWRGELTSAMTHLNDADWAAGVLGWPSVTAAVQAHRCVLELAAGLYGTAADTATAALRSDVAESLPAEVRARAHLVRGWAATYELDPRTAHLALLHVDRQTPAVDPVVRALTRLLEVRLTSQDGDHDRALRLLSLEDVQDAAPLFLVRLQEVARAEIAARARAIPALRDAARRLLRLGLVDDAELFECVAPADPMAAYEVLERLLMRPGLHPATAAGAATLRMCAALRDRDLSLARALLPDLLSRVRPQRLFVFLDVVARVEPDFMHLLFRDVEDAAAHPASAEALALLRRTHRPQTADPFLARTRAVDAAPTEVAAAGSRASGASTPEVHLTRRQADVLAELALGGSYRDIADHLYLTENSVKTHLGSLYRKLEVGRRSEALRRARELGLL